MRDFAEVQWQQRIRRGGTPLRRLSNDLRGRGSRNGEVVAGIPLDIHFASLGADHSANQHFFRSTMYVKRAAHHGQRAESVLNIRQMLDGQGEARRRLSEPVDGRLRSAAL